MNFLNHYTSFSKAKRHHLLIFSSLIFLAIAYLPRYTKELNQLFLEKNQAKQTLSLLKKQNSLIRQKESLQKKLQALLLENTETNFQKKAPEISNALNLNHFRLSPVAENTFLVKFQSSQENFFTFLKEVEKLPSPWMLKKVYLQKNEGSYSLEIQESAKQEPSSQQKTLPEKPLGIIEFSGITKKVWLGSDEKIMLRSVSEKENIS